jgi:type II secretory ATPase GspE/PulE/Tfp pilus assembly ATPase PilB-like protein
MRFLARLDRVRRVYEDPARLAVAVGSLILLLSLAGEQTWLAMAIVPVAGLVSILVMIREIAGMEKKPGEEGAVRFAELAGDSILFGIFMAQSLFSLLGVKIVAAIFGIAVVGISPFLGLGLGLSLRESRLVFDVEKTIKDARLSTRVMVIYAVLSLAVGVFDALWLGVIGTALALLSIVLSLIFLHKWHRPLIVKRAREGRPLAPFATREAETLLAASLLVALVALKFYLGEFGFAFAASVGVILLGALDIIQGLMYLMEKWRERREEEGEPTPVATPRPAPEQAPAPAPPPAPAPEPPKPAPVAEATPPPPPEPPPKVEPAPAEAVSEPAPPEMQATLTAHDGTEPEKSEGVALLAGILWRALAVEASEVKFHRDGESTQLRFVMDGVENDYDVLKGADYEKIRTAILALSGEERRFGAEGARGMSAMRVSIDRGSTNLEIQRPPPELPTLEALGMWPALQEQWRALVRGPGFILLAGPPESGKATTLYASLMEIDREKKKVISLERRLERNLPGVEHVEVPVSESLVDRIRDLENRTCDVLAIPDLDEPEAVREAMNFALRRGKTVIGATWASVFSLSSLAKLVDLGVDKLKIGEALRGILAQRLARRVCPSCKESVEPDADVISELKLPEPPESYFIGQGCDECGRSGYRGRIAIFELLTLRPFLAGRLLEEQDFTMIESILREAKFTSLRDDGVSKAAHGITTHEEVVRVLRER